MNLFLRTVFWIAVAGTVTSTIYCILVLIGAVRFALRRRREERNQIGFLPPVSVLKPLHGAEPDLEENLRGFFALDYPEYELLFCARQEGDAGLQIAVWEIANEFNGNPYNLSTVQFIAYTNAAYVNEAQLMLNSLSLASVHGHVNVVGLSLLMLGTTPINWKRADF